MDGPLTERDWKHIQSLKDELSTTLFTRINNKAAEIVQSGKGTPHDRYLRLFRHVKNSDKIVARCLDDWRRSKLGLVIITLRREGLLTDAHVQGLSDTARDWFEKVERLDSQ